MYSQNSEEEVICNYFRNEKLTFLDIGAYDGKKFSNIYRLCELGWNGVCIEPSPIVFTKLIENMKPFPTVKLVNSAISVESKILKFFDSNGDAVSSFSESHKHKWETKGGTKYKELWIKTITLDEIFYTFGWNFSFINLDVEGQNIDLFNELIKSIHNLPKLKCICIEHDDHDKEMERVLGLYGFKPLLRNGENIIMGKY